VGERKSALLMAIAATTGGSDGLDVEKLASKKNEQSLDERRFFQKNGYFVSAPFLIYS
jgi:hypothetical protein